MLQPKKTKYRKSMRGRMRGNATRGNELSLGDFGLQALTREWINGRQIEAARKVIVREMKRKGKLWIRVFPHKSYTKKAEGVRMGKGKGEVEGYVAVVKPGRILFEVSGVAPDTAKEALRKASQKLPILAKIIEK